MNKITALALGLLLLAVPGFAQYGGGSGTQTFTVPTLTVGPGAFITTGTTTFSGDFTIGSGAQLLLPDGSAADPALTWTTEDDSGWYRAGTNDFRFSIDTDGTGGDAFRVRQQDADTMTYDFEGPQYSTAKIGMRFQVDPGATTNQMILYAPNTSSIGANLKAAAALGTFSLGTGGAGYDYNINLWGAAADSFIRHYEDGEFTNYTQLRFTVATGQRTATFPDATGTVLLSGVANTTSTQTSINVNSNTEIVMATDQLDLRTTGSGDVVVTAAGDAIVDAGQSKLELGTNIQVQGTGDVKFILDSVAFASLPSVTNGGLIYCTDCTKGGTPCAGAGSGAVAKGEAGAWNCD